RMSSARQKLRLRRLQRVTLANVGVGPNSPVGLIAAAGSFPRRRASALPSGRKVLFARRAILERLHELHKLVDISNIADQAERNSDRTGLSMPTAAMYSSKFVAGLLKRSRSSCFVMPNAASPAPGLQKQPVRNEIRARTALRSTSRSSTTRPSGVRMLSAMVPPR